jgi:hypothetical protein
MSFTVIPGEIEKVNRNSHKSVHTRYMLEPPKEQYIFYFFTKGGKNSNQGILSFVGNGKQYEIPIVEIIMGSSKGRRITYYVSKGGSYYGSITTGPTHMKV